MSFPNLMKYLLGRVVAVLSSGCQGRPSVGENCISGDQVHECNFLLRTWSQEVYMDISLKRPYSDSFNHALELEGLIPQPCMRSQKCIISNQRKYAMHCTLYSNCIACSHASMSQGSIVMIGLKVLCHPFRNIL
jgi:hypothetical protein